MKVTGDADAYTLTAATTGGGASSPLNGPAPTVTFAGNHLAGPDSLTFTVTPPSNDDDLAFDVVTVEIDRDRLPPGLMLGKKTSWKVEIPDDQLRAVSFDSERIIALESEHNKEFHVGLFVHPPLPPNQGFAFLWYEGNDIKWSWNNCVYHAIDCDDDLREFYLDNPFPNDDVGVQVSASRSWNSYIEFTYFPRTDSDPHDETDEVTIIYVGNGFKIGSIPTFTFVVRDDVSFRPE